MWSPEASGIYEVKSAATGKVSNVTGQYGFPKIYSTSKMTGTQDLSTALTVADNNKKFQIQIDGVAFGDVVTLATGDDAAKVLQKINDAVKNAKTDGFTFKASVDAGHHIVLETYAADSAVAKKITKSMSVTWVIMRKPTTTRAGVAAS